MLTLAFTAAALGVTSITGIAALISSAFSAGQQREMLITRFGKHIDTIKEPGLHFKMPFIDRAIEVQTDLQQSSEKLSTKTKDDLFVDLPIAVQFQVEDTAKFYFKNHDAVANMMKLVSAAVRTATSGRQFQDLYTDRDEISTAVIEHIQKDVDDFGIKIRRIVIDEPTAPGAVQQAFNEVRASERLKEAAKNKAEAHQIEVIAKAQAERQADILRGEGKAGFRKAIFDQYREQIETLSGGDPNRRAEAIEVMMQAMHQDTLRDVGDKGNLVIVTEGKSAGAAGQSIAELQTLSRTLNRAPTPEQDNGGLGSGPKAAAPAP